MVDLEPLDSGDAKPHPTEAPPRSLTFIVRVSETEGGALTGSVEHARTGRKERFNELEAIARAIASMLGRTERADSDAKSR